MTAFELQAKHHALLKAERKKGGSLWPTLLEGCVVDYASEGLAGWLA